MTSPEAVKAAEDAFSRRYVKSCVCNGMRFLRFNFPLGHILFGKAIPCICQRNEVERRRADKLRKWSGCPQWQRQTMTFDTFQAMHKFKPWAKAKNACERYARDHDGWLVLHGPYGCGKTHLATAILNECLKRGEAAYLNTVAAMLQMLRSAYGVGEFEVRWGYLRDVKVLLLDDLGAQKDTDWVKERLVELVDWRYRQGLPLVVTTNTNLEQAEGVIEPRILSRLRQKDLVRIITLPPRDVRRAG